MRFNEFNNTLTEQEKHVNHQLKLFLEGSITKQDFIETLQKSKLDEIDFTKLAKLGSAGWGKVQDFFSGAGKGFGGASGQARDQAGRYVSKGSAMQRGQNVGGAVRNNPGKVAAGAAAAGAVAGSALGNNDIVDANTAMAAPTTAPANMDDSSFGKAFAAARKQHGGPGGKFTWRGKEYQTNVKGEKYVKNPTAVSFGGSANPPRKPATGPGGGQGETPVQSGGAAGEFGGTPTTTQTPVQSGGAAGEFGGTQTTTPTPAQPATGPTDNQIATRILARTAAKDLTGKDLSNQELLRGLKADIKKGGVGTAGLMQKMRNIERGDMGDDSEFADTGAMTRKTEKMPKAFGIGPRVDDTKGGETVKTPFGFSYKTLPKANDLSDRN